MLNITAEVLAAGNFTNVAEIMSANEGDTDSTFGNGPDQNPGGGVGSADPDGSQDPLDEDDADDAIVNPIGACGADNGMLMMGN